MHNSEIKQINELIAEATVIRTDEMTNIEAANEIASRAQAAIGEICNGMELIAAGKLVTQELVRKLKDALEKAQDAHARAVKLGRSSADNLRSSDAWMVEATNAIIERSA